jgi:hypothetical protein
MAGRWMSADEAVARVQHDLDPDWSPCCERHWREWQAKERASASVDTHDTKEKAA